MYGVTPTNLAAPRDSGSGGLESPCSERQRARFKSCSPPHAHPAACQITRATRSPLPPLPPFCTPPYIFFFLIENCNCSRYGPLLASCRGPRAQAGRHHHPVAASGKNGFQFENWSIEDVQETLGRFLSATKVSSSKGWRAHLKSC